LEELSDDSEYAADVKELQKIFHLNMAIANLHQGDNYRSFADNGLWTFAKDWEKCMHSAIAASDAALAIDPECDKAYLRRGTARNNLSFYLEDGGDAFASCALEDLQKAADLLKNDQKGLATAEKQLERRRKNDAHRSEAQPCICQDVVSVKSHPPVISALHIVWTESGSAHYRTTLDLRAGRCVALFGEDKADTSKVAQILSGELLPTHGRILHHGMLGATPGKAMSTAAWVISASVSLAIYTAAMLGLDPWLWIFSSGSGLGSLVQCSICGTIVLLLLLAKLCVDRKSKPKCHSVIRISDEEHSRDLSWTDFGTVLADALPKSLRLEDRQKKAELLLRASGSKDLQGPYSQLSVEQKQMAHVLLAFAKSPDVLICDSAFRHAELSQQLRLLHMLRRMKEEIGTSIVYISSDISHARLIADSVGYLSEGLLVELGPTASVLKSPKHPKTASYMEKQVKSQLDDVRPDWKGEQGPSAAWLPK